MEEKKQAEGEGGVESQGQGAETVGEEGTGCAARTAAVVAHLSSLEGLEQRKRAARGRAAEQLKKLAAGAEAGGGRPLPAAGPRSHGHGRVVTVVPNNHRFRSRPKPTLTRRSSSFSPDDEPEDFVVTEIQRIARGKFQRKSIVEAKLTAADELQRLKTEYDANSRP